MNSSHTYRGRLQLEESQLLEVDLRVAGKEVILVSSAGSLGVWPIDDVGVVRVDGDQFLLDLGGEKAIFYANDVLAFSYEGLPALGEPTRFATWRRVRRERRIGVKPVADSVPVPSPPRTSVDLAPVRAAGAKAAQSGMSLLVRAGKTAAAAAQSGGSTLARSSKLVAARLRDGAQASAEAREQRRQGLVASKPSLVPANDPTLSKSAADSGNGRPRGSLLPRDLARKSGKVLFAGADVFRGRWPGPRILIYHQVGTETGRQMEVTYESFAAQVEWMVANRSIVSLDEALRRRGAADADRLFVLTFDDGYADLFDLAYPLLEQKQVPFTLYLTTGHVESGIPLAPDRHPLKWDQVEAMIEGGLMTLGAHTHTHLDLTAASLDQVEDELGTSDQLIRARTGVAPDHFTYPWGRWSPIADTVVRRQYASATLGAGDPVTASTDPFLVHRLPIQRSDGFFFFKQKAHRGMPLEERARRIIRGYRGP